MNATLTKVRRHWYWARTQGIGRLIEEDDLNPATRARRALHKRRWRREHGVEPGTATPVFLLGLQRSGTNMIVRGLEEAPEFEVHSENDGAAFEDFRLRPLPDIAAIVAASQHRFVLFKPLCDSHIAHRLLDELGAGSPGRAIWAYRSVDGRVSSALAKFGDVNLRVLREIAAGAGRGRWQAQSLSNQTVELIRRFDWAAMTPASGAALFWYVRNSLFFELGLDRRPDVALVSYDAFVADPDARMRELCSILGFPWNPRLAAHVEARPSSGGRRRSDIDPVIRQHCDMLQERLDTAAGA